MTAKRTRGNGEGSIFPYRNGFAAYVWVTKPDGKRQRKYVYGKTRDEVHDKWIKLHQQARQGPVATRIPTLGDYLTYWLSEVVKPNLAPLTAATYETLVRLYIVPELGAKRLDRLDLRSVQTWINKVGRTCQCCAQGKDARRRSDTRRCCAIGKCCNSTPSPRTVKDLRTVLRSALSQAKTEELISRNVAALVKLPASRRRKGKAWTSEEARCFLESARSDRDPLYAAYVLPKGRGAWAGMGRGGPGRGGADGRLAVAASRSAAAAPRDEDREFRCHASASGHLRHVAASAPSRGG